MKTTSHWSESVVTAVRDVTTTVREFTLTPGDGVAEHWSPGSHLQVGVLVNGKPQTRSYSLIGTPDDSCYRIAVKRMDAGRGGSLAMWELAEGDRLQVLAPQNHFPLALDAPAYLLVAGGIGVTPMVSMALALQARGAQVRMIYGVRSADELAYGDELRGCLGDAMRTAIGEPIAFDAEIAALPDGAQLYVCGPVPMLDAARHAWTAAGREPTALRYETFGSSGRFAPQAFRVQLPRHSLDIMVPADCSLLDALEQAGVQTLSDCKRGECGLCAMDVIAVSGEIDHRDVYLTEDEKRENSRICACVSRVVGEVTLDSSWRADD
ncbi:PDR/VanB family oxidoreductase [Caenimonas sp. SL110]|uniref:PDR/VanB family oxidoreductase n=1 Tax=Caenimonas sp. SL110 TaxID=1450524 RepID=UPI000654523D|nr:PDR/VanB family oxidoreductase [Caenimonas sp. SL110]